MPIFEFQCNSCGHRFEELIVGGADDSDVRCPKCRQPNVEKLLSVFAGSGSTKTSAVSGSGCAPGPSRFS
jgi:putative FmdB family regulatory protein